MRAQGVVKTVYTLVIKLIDFTRLSDICPPSIRGTGRLLYRRRGGHGLAGIIAFKWPVDSWKCAVSIKG